MIEEVIGYYVDKEDELTPKTVMVIINDRWSGKLELTGYAPVGQHFGVQREYFEKCCREITKEEYMEVSKGIYTPEDYL